MLDVLKKNAGKEIEMAWICSEEGRVMMSGKCNCTKVGVRIKPKRRFVWRVQISF